MPSFGPGGLSIDGESVELVPSGTRTAAGSGAAYRMESRTTLRLVLDVTAASGTSPTMTATLEHSGDGSTWVAHTAFPAVTAVGSTRRTFGGVDRFARIVWTVGGTTPSFTFRVAGEAV